jgi:cell division protein FtsW
MAAKQAKTQTLPNPAYDIRLLFPVLFLVGIGIVMVYSASSAVALKKFGADFYFLKRQAIFAFLGLMVLVVCRHFPYRWLRPMAYPLLAVAIALLLAVEFSPWGVEAGGASRWLRLGPVSFQPSEFARLALIVYLAYSLDKKGELLKRFSVGFLPHCVVLGVLAYLISRQPDFGAIVILGALTWLMLFVGGARFTYLAVLVMVMLPAGYYYLVSADYRWNRVLGFLDPWKYPSDHGYQIVHSLMAFGSGGIWGSGIGKGYQKLFYLPEPHTDFIFSVIGEELGLVGVLVIVLLYGIVILKGIGIARRAPDAFGSFLATGLTAAMGLQICINMAVALGLLPTKGLTLPFISYGGSSLLMNMAAVGILMNIGAGVRQRQRQ